MSFELDPILFLEPSRIVAPDPWLGHIAFAHYLVKLTQPKLIVELGAHTGNSAAAFAHAQSYLGLSGETHAIDTWEGDGHAGKYGDEVYRDLLEFASHFFDGRLVLKRGYFKDWLAEYADESIDLLHVDGLHTYDAVKEDYETWLPKLAPGGVVLFHDVAVTKNEFGVRKYWREVTEGLPHFEMPNSHGLGVLMPKGESNNELSAMVRDGVPGELLNFLSIRQGQLRNYVLMNASAQTVVRHIGESRAATELWVNDVNMTVKKSSFLRLLTSPFRKTK